MDNNNMKYKRQNLWKRLKPEYKKAIKQGKAFSMYDVPQIIGYLRRYPTDPRLGFGGNKKLLQRHYFEPGNLPMPGVKLTNRTK